MWRNRKLYCQFFNLPPNLGSSLDAASRFFLRMATRSRDRNLKLFYPQFLIDRLVATVKKNVCSLTCLLTLSKHQQYWNCQTRIPRSCQTEMVDLLTYLRCKEWQIHLPLWLFKETKSKSCVSFKLDMPGKCEGIESFIVNFLIYHLIWEARLTRRRVFF